MQVNSKTIIAILTAIAILLFSNKALAAFSCNLSILPLNFGNFNPYNYTNLDVTTPMSVICTRITPGGGNTVRYTVTFSTGQSLNVNNRTMRRNGNNLLYNIYATNAYNQVLGLNSTTSTRVLTGRLRMNANQSRTANYVIYGRIPVQPLVQNGSPYTDSITVTLSWQ